MVLDTGSQLKLIPVNILKPDPMINVQEKINIVGINGESRQIESIGSANGIMSFNGKKIRVKFQVVDSRIDVSRNGLLGMDFLERNGAIIDIAEQQIGSRQPNHRVYRRISIPSYRTRT